MPVQVGILDKADGSAQLEASGRRSNKVIVSVTGPIEAKPKQELINTCALEVVVRPHQGLGTTRERLLEDKLRSLLQTAIVGHAYPRQLIQIVVQVLAVDGSNSMYTHTVLADALNAAYAALIDAGVALYYSFAASAAAINGGKVVYSPSAEISESSTSHHIMCLSIVEKRADKVLLLESNGDFTEKELYNVLEGGSEVVENVHAMLREVLEERLQRAFKWAAK